MWTDDPIETAFVGRAAEIQFLTSAAADPACRGVLILGIAGVGKTTLLQLFARELENTDRNPTFLSLRRYPNTDELFLRLSRLTKGQDWRDIKNSERGFFDQETHILLDGLDEFQDPPSLIHDLAFIINKTPHTLKLYITSRSLSDLSNIDDKIRVLNLEPFSHAEARHYLEINLRGSGVASEGLDAFAASCGRHPLLLRLIVYLRNTVDLSKLSEGPDAFARYLISSIIAEVYAHVKPESRAILDEMCYVLSGFADDLIRIDFLTELFGVRAIDILTASRIIDFQEGRTSNFLRFTHKTFKDYFQHRFLSEFPLDPHALDFGAEEAERDKKLAVGSVTPPILREIVRGHKSIVLGDRGSGKSALVEFLHKGTATEALSDNISQTHNPTFVIPNPEFGLMLRKHQSTNKSDTLTAEVYKEIWLLYFAENLARYVWKSLTVKETRKIVRRFC
jgi:predicted AAA+ superfamily ATPase